MPSTAHARIATPESSRLVKRLLTHWGHRFEVKFGEQHGEVVFDSETRAVFDAGAEVLEARIEASTPEQLTRMQDVVADHLQRMARAGALEIAWHAGVTPEA